MQRFNSTLMELNKSEVLRYAGVKKDHALDPNMVDEACLEARLLATPKGSWEIYDYDAETHTVQSEQPFIIEGNSIIKHLKDATKVIILCATVGEAIEEAVTEHFSEGRYAYSVLLDAAATCAVEKLADDIEKTIYPKVAAKSFSTRWRFSPGYGDWDITQQPDMVRLSGANDIGITLTESMMLYPRKSITAIIGLVPVVHSANDNASEDTLSGNNSSLPHPPGGCATCDRLDCPSRNV